MRQAGHRMNASVQQNVAGYLCNFQKGNAKQRKKSGLLGKMYTPPRKDSHIYTYI